MEFDFELDDKPDADEIFYHPKLGLVGIYTDDDILVYERIEISERYRHHFERHEGEVENMSWVRGVN
jgi:hypothetical protein